MVHVFVVGSKGIPAKIGGFETFVENLTRRQQSETIKYHVSGIGEKDETYEYNNAECYNVQLPMRGAFGRMLYVSKALSKAEEWIVAHPKENVVVYILGCRIGFMLIPHSFKLHRLHAKIYCNPDGLEWKRDKWNWLEKRILKYCESCLVRYSDLAVCDAKRIEDYVKKTYGHRVKATTYIAYGADIGKSECSDAELDAWLGKYGIKRGEYYFSASRFVPENNYKAIIREFIKSDTKKSLVITSNVEKNAFYRAMQEETNFENDPRIKLIDFSAGAKGAALLKKIREEAFANIHGHQVGGTSPTFLEALASTKLNLSFDVNFNREVGQDAVLYWTGEEGSLCSLINQAEKMTPEEIEQMGQKAKERITSCYSWPFIVEEFERLFNAAY